MKKILNEKGFTLMELMIVVAIIAVLAAIALPMISGAVDKARDAAEVADVRSVAASIAVYAANEDKSGADAGAQFATGGAQAANVPDTVTVEAATGKVSGNKPMRTDKVGKEGKIPVIEFGGSLKYVDAPAPADPK